MQIQIRNPVAVEIETADTETAVSLRFITATGHEAAVELTNELISDLLEKLKVFASEPAPAGPNLRALLRI